MIPKTIMDRLVLDPETGCWNWQGATNGAGYGCVSFGGRQGLFVHRVVLEHTRGIPEGLVVDHLCRNPLCANPEHLEAVTHRENILRGKGPIPENAAKTHCPKGHELSGDNLVVTKAGHRRCRECRRLAQPAATARYKAKDPERFLALGRERCRQHRQRKRANA
jgi:hypothetical protein